LLAPAFQAPLRRRTAPVYSDGVAKILLDSYYIGSRSVYPTDNTINAEASRFSCASTCNDAKHDAEIINRFLIMNWCNNYHITLFFLILPRTGFYILLENMTVKCAFSGEIKVCFFQVRCFAFVIIS
jgi:hypothetical protein